MAPRAHLAIYKVCPNCSDSDIIAAFEQAIQDGVHIINLSVSGFPTAEFYNDAVARSSYPAIEKGISVSVSAGNMGSSSSLGHSAPWLMVVGSTSTDRRLAATVKLGNSKEFVGETAYQPSWFNSSVLLPLAFPGINNTIETLYCKNGSMNTIDVKGKIVLCWSAGNVVFQGRVVKEAGGAAMILVGRGGNTPQVRHVLPVSYVKYADGNNIMQYYRSSLSARSIPKATIVFQGQVPGLRPAPGIDTTSSRGPSLTNGGILKPDVVAPGKDILGAWPYRSGPSDNFFRLASGTSMAAPHVAGIMALIKKKHPTWSPAAIQSAIITTAKDMDLDGKPMVDNKNGKPASIFAKGAGLVNPSGAMDPGLVYDRNISDYKGYMCGLGYSSSNVELIIRKHVNCTKVKKIKSITAELCIHHGDLEQHLAQ
ncbi:hypothetical protein J5N97_020839 [Dioscorea zingiberensis]|uniref:Uncharacterized protein n=1 Tax=Dioscorea zingiberensis TaxID=325984 RepID=A0A9D5CIS8_9LILI|nr:hypothetical protein J5N97_020839 [Dioscorea zingiberensis]